MTLTRPPLLLPILADHFVELDVLWERREAALADSEWTLRDLADLEARAARHLDGVLLGQEHAVDLARRALAGDERGAATAAAFVLWDLGAPELREELVGALTGGHPEVAHGVRLGLRHRNIAQLEAELRGLATHTAAVVRACACDVLAYHRLQAVTEVRGLLTDQDAEIRALACAAIGRWRLGWSAEDLRAQLAIPDAAPAHRAALETSARLALPELAAICAETDAPPEALKFLGVIGGAEQLPVLQRALADPARADAALAGLGALGLAAGVPAILEALARPLTAHAAAAAFLRITGARDVQGAPVPPPAELGEDAAEFWDEVVAADPELAGRWWRDNAARFEPGRRQQGGVAVEGWPLDAGLTVQVRSDACLGAWARKATQFPEVELEGLATDS